MIIENFERYDTSIMNQVLIPLKPDQTEIMSR